MVSYFSCESIRLDFIDIFSEFLGIIITLASVAYRADIDFKNYHVKVLTSKACGTLITKQL